MSIQSNVLLLEDSEITQTIVRSALADLCRLTVCANVAQTLDVIDHDRFDLILLDVGLPDGNGFDVYAKIREHKSYLTTPIIFLTGRSEVDDKVKGFSLGADDYIVKPFDIVEFRSRVAAKLRNLVLRGEVQGASAEKQTFGPYTVKAASQTISMDRGDGPIELQLTANQFKIFFYLLRHADRTVTRSELLKEIWGEGVHVSNRTIDTHVYAIRRELGDDAKHIRSVHGSGYCFSLSHRGSSAAS